MKKFFLINCLFMLLAFSNSCIKKDPPGILVFTKNQPGGYIHDCIPASVDAIMKMGRENGFLVDTTSVTTSFSDEYLEKYHVVVFSNTNNRAFDDLRERMAFQRYIQAGGAFVGIHSAAGSERDWEWFSQLLGGRFEWHPPLQPAVIDVVDKNHPSTEFLPDRWERTDEWYLLKNMNPDIHVLATLDSSTYDSERMGADYPTAWYHVYDGGRSFYTAGGHRPEDYSDPLFYRHILGGILWALGDKKGPDYRKARTAYPAENEKYE